MDASNKNTSTPMAASKLERRILLGKLINVDIMGKPVERRQADLESHADTASLGDIYDNVVAKLNEQPTPTDRVNTALSMVVAETTVEPTNEVAEVSAS